MNEDGEEISEGYGWTVNLSQSGVRIETFRPIETRMVLLLAVDIRDELLEIQGEVVYAQPSGQGRCLYGIRFLETEEQRRTIASFVKSYYHRDKALAERIDYERLFKERE